MPLIIQTTTAKVVAIQGRAFIRDSLGNLRALKVGDVVVKGDQVLTEQDTIVQMTQDLDGASAAGPASAAEPTPAPLPRPAAVLVPRPAPPAEPASAAAQDVERAIIGIERAAPQDAPGAGLSSAEGGFLPGLRVDRVVEPVVPASVHTTPISGASLPALPLDDTQRRAAAAPEPEPEPVLPALSVADARVNESAGTLSFSVSLNAPSALPVSVNYSLTSGTATLGADFTAASGTLRFAPGVTELGVSVPIQDDTVFEGDETFFINLQDAVNASLADAQGQATIIDNDAAPVVSVLLAGAEVTEGAPLVFDVSLSNASASVTTLAFSLAGGSAGAADIGAPSFSHGVSLNLDGSLSVPAGVAAFSISVPTLRDELIEPDETLRLSVGGVSANGLIHDGTPPPLPALAINDVSVNEAAGTMSFTVSLSAVSSTPVSVNFGTADGTASAGADYTTTLGSLSFAPGVLSLTLTVPIVDDAVFEGNERFSVTLSAPVGATLARARGVGEIIDNDSAPVVLSVQPGAPGVPGDAVPEGTPLVFTVTLGGLAATPQTYPFSLGGGTAGAADFGAPLFSNGVVLNANGTLTVPAGVASFTITVPTTQDSLVEGDETVRLSVGGVVALGTIVDDDLAPPPTITGIEPGAPGAAGDAVPEGTPAVFTVSLSGASNLPQTYPFNLGGGTAGAADFGTPLFSNGVVLNADGTITVPAGVASFTVTVPTTQDNIDEPLETLPLSIGGITAVASIIDDDPAPGVASVALAGAGARVPEGAELSWAVTLSNPSSQAVTLAYQLGGGTASAADFGTPAFSNGVVLNADGTLTVPAGVTSFTVTLPTTQDSLVEGDETVRLSVGGVSATGTIVDDDVAPPPTITGIEPGAPGAAGDAVPEGTPAVFTVSLSGASSLPQTYPFNLGGGTAGAADFGAPLFSNGVVLNADGTITVPPGVASFSVSVPTTQDSTHEADETLPLRIGGVSATATIIDDDPAPIVIAVTPDAPRVNEGNELVFTVSLSAASELPLTLPFGLGGTAGAADIGAPLFSNGVTLNPDGTLNVPAGVTSFSVTLPTLADGIDEPDETLVLNVGGVAGSAVINDGDPAPGVISITLATASVPEGGTMVFNVALGGASAAPTSYPFSLGGGTASAADFGVPVFSNGVVLNADGTITVPAGVASFSVSVPTLQDLIDETDESLTLTVGGASASGTIVDDDAPPSVTGIEPGAPGSTDDVVPEGSVAVFTVSLSGPSVAPLTLPFSLGGGSAGAGDFGAPVFSAGVVLNADGTITVPPGVSSFTVSVPTTQDSTQEANETLPISIGGITATATIIDDDPVPSVGAVVATGGRTAEGGELVFSVTLNGNSDQATSLPFNIGGGTAGLADIGTPVFNNGVTLNADGTLNVPPGVASFTITVPVLEDGIDEIEETLVLNVGGVSASGIITAGFAPPIILIEPGVPGSGDDSVREGDTGVFTVTLAGAPNAPAHYAFSLGGGSAGAGDYGAPVFSNGVVLNADGTITVPAGVTTFVVSIPTVQDSLVEGNETVPLRIGSITATLTIIDDDGPNGAPLAGADSASTPEDAAVLGNVLANDSDGQQQVLTVTGVAFGGQTGAPGEPLSGAWGSLVLNPNGAFIYTPGAQAQALDDGQRATDVFTYAASDGAGGLASTTLTVTIVGSNDAPITSADTGSTPEDTPISGNVLANDSDPDGEPVQVLSYSVSGLAGSFAPGAPAVIPNVGELVINADGSFSFEPVPDYHGPVPAATYLAGDGSSSTPGTLSLSVTPRNDVPQALADAAGTDEDTAVSGNVLVNDSDVDGPGLLVADVSFGGSSVAPGAALVAQYGNLVVQADGQYTYTPGAAAQALLAGQSVQEQFSYTVSDGAGGSAQATLTLTVVGRDDAPPLLTPGYVAVSEEGLGGGLPDAQGSPQDGTNATSTSGTVRITDPEGGAISNLVLQAPVLALTSGGAAVAWAGSGTQELVASANGQVVASVSIDDAGHYGFKLLGALDHPAGGGENMLTLDIGVSASDGARQGSGVMRIHVEDDAPSVAPVHGQVNTVDSNVMIVLDVSGSMANASGISGLTRLQAAVKAVGELLDRYDDAGNVAVRLVTFSSHAKALGECWTTVAQAKALLANVQANGGTNYDEALADAMAAFGAGGKISGAQNVSYFLSDGKPTYGSGTVTELSGGGQTSLTNNPATNGTGHDGTGADTGIQVVEEGLWTQFLNANQINSFALGLGGGLPNTLALDPVAYDGRAHTNTAGQLVTDFHALGSMLLATTASHSGQLLAGVGADGGALQSFSVGGVSFSYQAGSAGEPGTVCASGPAVYRFDAATQTLHVPTAAGGEFHVDMVGGGYSYSAPAAAHAGFSESFAFSVVDGDGDVAQASGSLNVAATVSSGTTAGADLIHGTPGADYLLGGGGADVFKWSLGDPGQPGAPVADRIGDFNPASRSAGGDVLDLRDLLQGESLACGSGNLANFLDFDTDSLPGSTVLRVSSSGGFTQGQYNACAEDQRIVLEGVDLRSSLGLGCQASDSQIIQELLNRNKLEVGP